MKPIGILTFHRSFNYGAFMQAYALSVHLRSLTGRPVEFVNYDSPRAVRFYRQEVINSLRRPWNTYMLLRRNRAFRSVSSALTVSDSLFVSDDFTALFARLKGKYDLIVVGSDAVWNWNLRGFPNAYLLHGDLGCPKMSYAASTHGLFYDCVTEDQRAYLRESLRQYSFVSVRDLSSKQFIESIEPTMKVHRTCDPTLLLDMAALADRTPPSRLRARLSKKYRLEFNRPMIGLMSRSQAMGKAVRAEFGKTHQIVSLYVANRYADCYLFDLTPFEWAQVFRFFALTFTQYFHGTLLSLKNGTPVIAVDSWPVSAKYTGKLEDVLRWLKLEDSYFLNVAPRVPDWAAIMAKAHEHVATRPAERIRREVSRVATSVQPFDEAVENSLRCVPMQ